MDEFVLPGSPNWFLSSVSSGTDAGLYAFGSKNHVFVYDLREVSQARHDEGTPQFGVLSQKMPKLISCFRGHDLKVSSVCLSPDPEQWVCCSADEATVKLWDVMSLTILQVHTEHKDRISCMTWSQCDQDLILTADEKGKIVLWHLKSNTVTSFQPHRGGICSMKASPHSSHVVAVGYRTGLVLIIGVDHGQLRILHRLMGHEGEISSICWCPVKGDRFLEGASNDESEVLVATAGRRLIKIWSSTIGKEVFFKKLPQGDGHRLGSQDSVDKKLWLDVQWPKTSPEFLISSSPAPQGELLLWNLQDKKQQKPELFDSLSISRHSRLIFNIAFVGDKICTFSLDRVIAVWDMKSRKGLISWSSFGGYPYCIRASPVDPGMVAVGSGDNTIRVWNQNNKSKPFDITSLFYGLRSIITSIAWHPEREGLLAYGTEDGRVGVFNTLVVKPPLMSNTFHKKTVYVVCWGPPVHAETGSHQYEVYSLGDGTILQHFISEFGNSRKDAVNFVEAISAANAPQISKFVASDITWRSGFTAFAIGCDNGSVSVYSFPDLRQVFVISVHQRIINCVRWHPDTTAESLHSSPCRNWMAFAGSDQHITVVEVPSIFATTESGQPTPPAALTRPLCQLPGHVVKTTDMCWSPHHDGRLVSVGYDKVAIIWNVKTCEVLASYSQHNDRLLTVLWSYLDPDIVITGGFDATVRIWRVSAQPKTVADISERKKKKKFVCHAAIASHAGPPPEQLMINTSEGELKELQELLKLKQQQLLSQLESDAVIKSDAEDLMLMKREDSGYGNHQELPLKSTREPECQTAHEGDDIVQDSAQTLRRQESRGSSLTHGDVGCTTQVPSSFVLPDAGQNSRLSSAHNKSAAGSPSRARVPGTASALRGEESASDDDGDDDGSSDSAEYEKVPSASDLVAPAKTLLPRSGVPFAVSKLARGSASRPSAKEVAGKSQRKTKPKSLFPVFSRAFNQGKASLQEDVLDLTRILTGQGSAELVDSKPHLGVFADRLGAHRCLLQESEYHLSHDNMEYHLQLELWRGNVAGAIQIARQRNELSDWIVAMAPLASHDLWELVSAEYAEQLEEDGQYHKAATYLLAAHKIHQAIDLFRRHRLFKEAVSLARIRLSPVDPLLEDLFTEWGQNLMKEGQFEQAAKCYLAMRHIQEAGKMLARRHGQSSLKTACHMTLLANENEQGMSYAYRAFSQYLVVGDWQEAYKFITEHEALRIFLPILITHELLIQQLMVLCPTLALTKNPVTPEMFSQWEKKENSKCKTELPEFLIDKSETDSVIPWEPLLIGEHTFPHHLLRVWHQQLNVTMATQELRLMHAAITQLMSQTQNLADVPSMLVLVSIHITLCLLALLTSETSSAIIQLLQVLSVLQQANQPALQQALCRLMLSQGPKYLLKLQQEFNAARVLITMESHGDMDKAGGESHNSIKKFLTEIKDDSAISVSSLRCRELDCLRAYYYLVVLDYIGERFPCPQIENDSLDGMPNGKEAAVGLSNNNVAAVGETGRKRDVHRKTHEDDLADLDQNGRLSHADFSSFSGQLSSDIGSAFQNSTGQQKLDCDRTSVCDDGAGKSASCNLSCKPSSSPDITPSFSSSNSLTSSVPRQAPVDPATVPSGLPLLKISPLRQAANGNSPSYAGSAASPSQTSPSSRVTGLGNSSGRAPGCGDRHSSSSPGLKKSLSPDRSAVAKGCLNYLNLTRLSKGILWDVQAKREALTETLGYIHQAISQHLLLNRSSKDGSQSDAVSGSSVTSSRSSQQATSSFQEEDGGYHSLASLPESETASGSCKKLSTGVSSQNSKNALFFNRARSLTPQPAAHAEDVLPRGPFRSLSENYSTCTTPASPLSMLEHSGALQIEEELLGPLATESVAYQKSRKVLWIDGQETCPDLEQFNGKLAFQASRLAPGGSPIPVEWDGLPVDVKYSMPYVTLQLLRQEQEKISQELKRVPDVSKIPFPATSTGVKKLLYTSLRSPHLSKAEKKLYFKHLGDWSTVFAITTHQQNEITALFAAAEAEHLTE